MLALEGVVLAALYLQVEIGSKICDFLFYGLQSHKPVKVFQTLMVIHCLWLLVGNVLWQYGHQVGVARLSEVILLKSLSLTLAYCVEELSHGSAVGEILVP